MPKTRLKDVLREFVSDVWNKGKIASADKYLAPQYSIRHDPGDPWDKKVLDLEGFKERVRILRAPCPDQCFEIQELFEDGSAVVMTWSWTATHAGEIAGFEPTGKKLRMSGATVYYFEGERISGHWQIKDALGVYQQLRG